MAALTGPKVLGLVQQTPYVRELLADYDRNADPHYVPEEELVAKAIEILSQDPDGFFLAIDVDQIDVAGHASHAGLVIKSADMLNRIVRTVEAYRATDPSLLFVVTADHETGGMTIEGPNSNSTSVLGFPIPNRWRSGPFEIEGTSDLFKTDWTTPGHTGAPVPLTAAVSARNSSRASTTTPTCSRSRAAFSPEPLSSRCVRATTSATGKALCPQTA